MINALIIDDEPECIEILKRTITASGEEIKVLATFTDPREACRQIDKLQPDLLFLDVEMPSMNGFEVMKTLGNPKLSVIFTTAYEKYALQAIKSSALDYLLKPIDPEDLHSAIQRFKEKQTGAALNKQVEVLMNNYFNRGTAGKKLALPTANGLEFIPLSDIIRIEADGSYSRIHLKEKSELIVSRNLKEMQEMTDGYNFLRVHQSHLVNLALVKRYIKGDGGALIMEDKAEVNVSRAYKEELIRRLREL